MGQIRRQTLISSLIIYSGFLLGAFNLIYVLPRLLPVEYIGLTRLIQDFAAMLTAFAGLGFAGPFYRFGPYFEKYSKPGGNDLLQLFLIVTHIGVLVVFCVCYLFRADIIANFQVKSPLFSTYFYATFLFAYFFIIYNLLELYLFSKGQAILQSFTREILIRIIVLALTLLTFYFVSLRQFVWLYAGHYLIPVIILVIAIYKKYPSPIGVGITRTTKRLLPFMSKMASWGIVQTIVSTGVPVLDTLVIGGIIGLKGVAEYQIMSYVSTLVQVPVRATISILGAQISQLWMQSNLSGIQNVYQRTSTNYLAFGLLAVGVILPNLDLLNKITGKNIDIDFSIIAVLISARVFELSTGLSNVIIAYSKKWRYENIISIINIVLAIPLNIFMVNRFGMIGAAFTTLILLVTMFVIRMIILYRSYNLFPFSVPTLYLLGMFAVLFGILLWLCNIQSGWYYRLILSGCFALVFIIAVVKLRISKDINIVVETILSKLLGINIKT